jgi:hypothetical protein
VPGPATDFGVPQCHSPKSNPVESFPAGGEARERGGEGEGARSAEHRADANGGARYDHPPGSAAASAFQTPARTATPATPARRLAWAALLQRVFEVDALRCPGCGVRMRLIAAIEDPEVARKILECLDLPARAPPLEPAPITVSLGPEIDFADQEQQSWGSIRRHPKQTALDRPRAARPMPIPVLGSPLRLPPAQTPTTHSASAPSSRHPVEIVDMGAVLLLIKST